MKRMTLVKAFVIAIGSALVVSINASVAQEIAPPKLEPSACQKIQDHVNEVVKISQSSLSDEQKVEQLSKSWGQSLAAMQDKAKTDDEMTKLVGELSKEMGRVLTLALASSAKGDQPVSAAAQVALKDVQKQFKPYLSFMKMLCPDLVLPPEVLK